MLLQLRIRILHEIDDEISDLIKERTFESQRVVPLVDRASHDLAQHVIPAFVTRQYSVSNREGGRACMVRNDAYRKTFLCFRFVMPVGELRGEVDDRANQIRVVV